MKDWILSFIPEDKTFGYEFNKADLKNLDYQTLIQIKDAIDEIVIDIEDELIEVEKEM